MAKERKTWIDDQVNLETSKRLNLVKIARKATEDDLIPLPASLLDEGFDKVVNALEARGFSFKPELKSTLFDIISFVAWNSSIENFMGALNDLGADTKFKQRDEIAMGIGYCPVKRTIKNQYTGDTTSDDLHVFLLWNDVPVVEAADGDIMCDCHSLQGIYMADANVIVCDLTMCDNSYALCHEMYHCIIKSLRNYLDGAMYDQGPDQREEICVHFMTDGFERLANVRKLFGSVGDGNSLTATDCDKVRWDGSAAKKSLLSLKAMKRRSNGTSINLHEMRSCSFSDAVKHLSKRFESSNSFRSFRSPETRNSISHCSYKSKFSEKWRYKDGN
jgi:hypothetical protein